MLTPLARAAGLRFDEYRCEGRAEVAEERNERHEIVFVRRGAFHVESERGRAFVDAQRLLLLHRDEHFRVTHPAGCGDCCLIVGIEEPVLGELLTAARALDENRPESPFRALTLASTPALHRAADGLRARWVVERGDPLTAAEELLTLVTRTLDVPAEATPRRERRGDELVEAVRLELARHLGERLPLPRLAAAVGASPFHLARLFRRRTGSSIHQYRLELRLREAYGRLLEGERDLTRLALDLGFADHAHFTNTFRSRYGAAPSRVRALGRPLSALRPRRRPSGVT